MLDLGTQTGQLDQLVLEGVLAMLEEVLYLVLVLLAEGAQHWFDVGLLGAGRLGSWVEGRF